MAVTASFQGSAAAPAAGTVIAGKTGLPPGLYRVVVATQFIAGTPAAADVDNFNLLVDGVIVAQLPSPAALNSDQSESVVYTCNVQSGILSVTARANATAGVTYDAVVTYTKDA